MMKNVKTKILIVFLVVSFTCSFSHFARLPTSKANPADVTVTIDTGQVIGTNIFSSGFQLDGRDISYWRGSSAARSLAQDANLKLVRFFYHRLGQPCTSWNEGTKTGSWSWSATDDLVNKIFAMGGEPLIVLGFARFDGNGLSGLPSGMSADGTTRLPDPSQWGAYCADWVKHFEDEGMNVRYYEIINEPHHYFDWGGINIARRGYFKDVFNKACIDMRAENDTIKIGNDNSMVQSNSLNEWMASNLEDLNFLSWHGYLTGSKSSTDAYLIDKAQTDEGGTYGPNDFIQPARQDYYNEKGAWLPVIQSEANLNYAYTGGTDPRIQQMLGGVYVGLWSRMLILEGTVTHNVFFDFAGSGASDTKFGMVNKDNDVPWYPYYTHYLIEGLGALSVGDDILTSSSTSSTILPLVWKHADTTNILLIHSSTSSRSVALTGVSGTYSYAKINDDDSGIQSGSLDVGNEINFVDYTVMLLQQESGGAPDNPPSYSDIGHNTTIAGNPIEFSCNWTDDNGLSGYIPSTNNTGQWVNGTFTSLTGTQDWANVTDTLNSTSNVVVQYKWYCNDSANQWTITPINSLVTETSSNIPVYSNAGTTSNINGSSCKFFVKWSDIEGLSGFIFGTNNTGNSVNETWTSLTGVEDWAEVTKTLNETVGTLIQWQVWCNDTDSHWTVTEEFFLVTEQEFTENTLFFETKSLLDINEGLEDSDYPFLDDCNGTIKALSYSSTRTTGDLLSFRVSSTSSKSYIIVNTMGKGTPSDVSGATWTYNNGILTLIVTHASDVDVGVAWADNDGYSGAGVSSFLVKEGIVFKTSSNNGQFVIGDDFSFCKVEVNSTYLWMDKSYSTKHYTRYCLYVVSPDNCSFTVDSWFATANSTAQLRINSPLGSNIDLRLYSPNLISASAIGVVSYTWLSANKTLIMTCNSNVNPITISASVTETGEENTTPENYDVIITDMEGCGNWVFSEEAYYTFQAQYWDGDGYAELDTCKIAFTDGVTWVNASYDVSANEYTLESGDDVARLKAGSMTIADPNLLQVTFLFYFQNKVLDAYNVDIYLWCNDTSGALDDWEIIAEDYFNIYNLGGHSTLTSSGNTGRSIGGDVFDLYAYNNSWVDVSMIFRDLQHVKMLPLITYTNELAILNWSLTFYMDYCVGGSDTWVKGLKCVLHPPWEETYWFYRTTEVFHNLTVDWYNHDELVRSDTFYIYNFISEGWLNASMNLWFDFWINKQNASSIIGGRLNAYYFPMTDDSNGWLRWLTGSNWGIDESKRKQTMFFETMLDENGETLYASEISFVKLGCRLQCWYDNSMPIQVKVSDFDVFDLTLGGEPFTGISTPVFDETKVPVMPQGGFLGTVVSWFQGAIRWLSDNLMFGGLNLWGNFVGFMDTIAAWLGFPGGFSDMMLRVASYWAWLTLSFGWLTSMLVSTFNFLYAFMGKLINTVSTALGIFTNMFNQFFFMIGTGYGYTVGTWEMLGMTWWVTIFFILYPLFLLGMWEERGLDAVISHINGVKDILAFIGTIFIRVIQLTLNLIGRIIESIPVVE